MAALVALSMLAIVLAGYHYSAALTALPHSAPPAAHRFVNAFAWTAALPPSARRHYVLHLIWGNAAFLLAAIALTQDGPVWGALIALAMTVAFAVAALHLWQKTRRLPT
ncbi:MAG TPA: hypothetical protein VG270_05705 [Pseudolabrys sp.]|nr:hypothetical protein [Pseudolabrys sp.]